MGGGQSSHSKAKAEAKKHKILTVPPVDENEEAGEETPEQDDDDDFEDPEEKAERLARMAKAAEKKILRKRAKKLSKARMKTTAEEQAACVDLKDQLRSRIVMRQETVKFLSTKFGTEPMSKCRYRLPNKKYDYDHIEVKSYAMSRENDFNAPSPINVP